MFCSRICGGGVKDNISMMKGTARAGANIAFVKYWGHRGAGLNLPLNDSISMTLDNAATTTTVAFDPEYNGDTLVLNGRPADGNATLRASAHLDRLRALAGVSLCARVVSTNSFPTGAGIASSASGFAALTLAAATALALDLSPIELSRIARLASGSACRSIPGGFVEWRAGTGDADSYAEPIPFPEGWVLLDIVAVVSAQAKPVSSEAGHALAATSPFLSARLAAVPAALDACRAAIADGNLAALGEIAEVEALSLHVVAMTSRPSTLYWAPGTVALMHAVRTWREEGLPAYFTIDAGPNVHILTLPTWQDAVMARLAAMPEVSRIIVCRPGPGAQALAEHLF
jgi:diphosphomevalonate decarboxylase